MIKLEHCPNQGAVLLIFWMAQEYLINPNNIF